MRLLQLSATALPVELWTISPSSIASSKGGEREKERERDDFSSEEGRESFTLSFEVVLHSGVSIDDLIDGHACFGSLQLTHEVGYQLHNLITSVEV